jgi:hypothetical protein
MTVRVFGKPPKYNRYIDYNSRAYKKLWNMDPDDDATANQSNFYNVIFRIGSPNRIKLGVLDTVFNQNPSIETLDVTIKNILENWSDVKVGLNSFTFGTAIQDGENKYLSLVSRMIEMFHYGILSRYPSYANKSPYLDSQLIPQPSLDEAFPEFQVFASSETTISENVSNEVGDSILKSLFDKSSSLAREINFIGGNRNVIKQLEDISKDENSGLLGSVIGSVASGAQALSDLAKKYISEDLVELVVAGNQLVMPQIWKGSSFSKKYTINFRLSSPYGDPYSFAKYIAEPLAYILPAATPILKSPNTVSFPFLVQVDSPGAFSINLGLITGINIRKGGREDLWTNTGSFRSLDISLEIVDLYEIIPMPSSLILSAMNKQARDYVSNLVGGFIISDDRKRYNLINTSNSQIRSRNQVASTNLTNKEKFNKKSSTISLNNTTNAIADQNNSITNTAISENNVVLVSTASGFSSGLISSSTTPLGSKENVIKTYKEIGFGTMNTVPIPDDDEEELANLLEKATGKSIEDINEKDLYAVKYSTHYQYTMSNTDSMEIWKYQYEQYLEVSKNDTDGTFSRTYSNIESMASSGEISGIDPNKVILNSNIASINLKA